MYLLLGIYIGNHEVVNFSSPRGEKTKSSARIMRTSLDHFRESVFGFTHPFIRVYRYDVTAEYFSLERPGTGTTDQCHSNGKTVEIAELLADHPWDFGEYNLIYRNCEGFAKFCKTTTLTVEQIKQMSKEDVLDKVTKGYGNEASPTQVVWAIAAVPYAPIQKVIDIVKWTFGR